MFSPTILYTCCDYLMDDEMLLSTEILPNFVNNFVVIFLTANDILDAFF